MVLLLSRHKFTDNTKSHCVSMLPEINRSAYWMSVYKSWLMPIYWAVNILCAFSFKKRKERKAHKDIQAISCIFISITEISFNVSLNWGLKNVFWECLNVIMMMFSAIAWACIHTICNLYIIRWDIFYNTCMIWQSEQLTDKHISFYWNDLFFNIGTAQIYAKLVVLPWCLL